MANYHHLMKMENMFMSKGQKTNQGLVVEARLTSPLEINLTNSETMFVLENAMRCLLNLVPDNGETNLNSINEQTWKGSSHMQRHEIFGCHAIVDFLLSSYQVIESLVIFSKERKRETLLDQLLQDSPNNDLRISLQSTGSNVNSLDLRKSLKKFTFFIAEDDEICTDLSMRNAIQYCMDFEQPLSMAN